MWLAVLAAPVVPLALAALQLVVELVPPVLRLVAVEHRAALQLPAPEVRLALAPAVPQELPAELAQQAAQDIVAPLVEDNNTVVPKEQLVVEDTVVPKVQPVVEDTVVPLEHRVTAAVAPLVEPHPLAVEQAAEELHLARPPVAERLEEVPAWPVVLPEQQRQVARVAAVEP